MSLHPEEPAAVPALTARMARAAFPDGCLGMRIRDALGAVFDDDEFCDLFSRRGQSAYSPGRLAMVCVLQFVEGLSDRQAATAVRDRISWKYALGLELTDCGFDYSVLSEFRTRLIEGGAQRRIFDLVLAAARSHGLLGAAHSARTDSTHVLGAVRTLNRLELVAETLRAALNAMAVTAAGWLGSWMPPEWADRYGRRIENFRLPQSEPERAAYAVQVGQDGCALLARLDACDAPSPLGQIQAVHTLRAVWSQQYEMTGGTPRWRGPSELPASAERIASPYDTECRYAIKRSMSWVGYKTHLTEQCDAHEPHMIVDVETTDAATSDQTVVETVHDRLARHGLLPTEHFVDTGYMAAETLIGEARDHEVHLVGPMPPDTSWQAKANEGFDVSHFTIDWQRRTASCPRGVTSCNWREQLDNRGHRVIRIRFPDQPCAACEARAKCTRRISEPRDIVVRPQQQHEALQQRRHEQDDASWQRHYGTRAGVEGTISQAVRGGPDIRHARYRGLLKAQLQHLLTGAALNLIRLDAWLTDTPLAKTRTSPLATLTAAT
ncbi:MAG TPA: IS1182 family transposase [Streptosporangiaceae bacterium]|nr:IS1182 family transposase [Streptosporangiaceae bacterium]